MSQPSGTAPPIAFLGFCRAVAMHENPTLPVDLIGLATLLTAPVVPLSLDRLDLIVAVHDTEARGVLVAKLLTPSGRELYTLTLRSPPKTSEPGSISARRNKGWVLMRPRLKGWLLDEPGLYDFVVGDGPERMSIGTFFVDVPVVAPLTPEVASAQLAYPGAHDSVEIQYKCGKCGREIRPYTSYERRADIEATGAIWYQDLPDKFECDCGGSRFSLVTLRTQMHALLDPNLPSANDTSVSMRYNARSARALIEEFHKLIASDPPEDKIQAFLEANPVFLSSFVPSKIIRKAPILNNHVTDFAIVNHSRELILVEIEKPTTRLLRADGGTAAPLQQAIDQVTNWLHDLKEHRQACLDGMGLVSREVAAVRGVVIAGRNSHGGSEALRRLRGTDRGPVSLMTYDDLAIGLQGLAEQLDGDAPGPDTAARLRRSRLVGEE